MDVMYVRHRVGGPARLLSGESLLHEQDSGKLNVKRVLGLLSGEKPLQEPDHLRAISIYCSPFCQALMSPAQLHSFRLVVTDRRALLSWRPVPYFPFYLQETDLWFPGQQPEGKKEIITSASLGEGRFGPCLEIRSRNPHRRDSWLTSSTLIVRIYCAEPEHIGRIVCDNLGLSGNIAIEGAPKHAEP